jgi:hypothetical protein
VDRLILRMLPAEFRARHGDEIEEMLASSRRPTRDRTDLVLAALGLRLGRALRVLVVAAFLGTCVCAIGVVIAVDGLASGGWEIPRHWWSTMAVVSLCASLVATLIVVSAQRRVTSWRSAG